ncbi:MAG TPA: hypothetical protein PLN52_02100 [Opitutaceae bacterium]|nr:hypothetical protein [Opitutaceae bacterium]
MMSPVRALVFLFLMVAVACSDVALMAADASPDEALRALVARQKELLASAEKKQSQVELEDLRHPLQQLCFDYEDFLRRNPDLAAGYVSYALLLDHPVIDERRRATGLLLKANQLDPELPLVKNQLGNHVAEMGKPLEALNYFLAAIRLAPKESLYHYQLGTLLAEARDDFLKSGEWTATKVDEALQRAFLQASLNSPNDWRYAYRYGLSFYDVEKPDWETALAFWTKFEADLKPGIEQQTCRVHRAKVLVEMNEMEEAKEVLSTITEPALTRQKKTVEEALAQKTRAK